MTWADFKTLVFAELATNATRRGIESLRDRSMRNAVIDLQRFIRPYRNGHTTSYDPVDLTVLGNGMLGQMPTGAIPEALYILHVAVPAGQTAPDSNCARNRLNYIDWNRRERLLCQKCDCGLYGYSIAPSGFQFLIHPALNDETQLLLVWNGLKQDFEDTDIVPWPSQAAEAVAAYMLWRITMLVDKNPALASAFKGQYDLSRRALFRDAQETMDAEKVADEYAGNASLFPFEPDDIPLLIGITSLAGTTNSALAAVPTNTRRAGYSVYIFDVGGTGQKQTWTLVPYTGQMGAGYVSPNDQSPTNLLVWEQTA